MVPSTSSWPEWPTRTIVYPWAANFLASTWTLLTRVGVHARGDPVGGEDDGLALGHLGLLIDEDRAALAQLVDHVLVVDDLLAHVDGRAVDVERALDGLDGAVDACAVPARGG